MIVKKGDITSTKVGFYLWHQERSILEVTEMICEIMESEGVTKAELAKRLGLSRGRVSQLLDGTDNMTLRKVSDLFTALGRTFHPSCKKDEESPEFLFGENYKTVYAPTTVKSLNVVSEEEGYVDQTFNTNLEPASVGIS